MSDLTDRLRDAARPLGPERPRVLLEAAAEIDRLTAELAEKNAEFVRMENAWRREVANVHRDWSRDAERWRNKS